MSFDWGGFLGGVIGTVGAFGAAVYTLKKQESQNKPSKQRMRLEIALEIKRIIIASSTKLFFEQPTSPMQLTLIVARELDDPLNKLLPSTYAAGTDLAEIILNLKEEMIFPVGDSAFGHLINKRAHDNPEFDETYNKIRKILNNYLSKISSLIVHMQNEIRQGN